MAAAIVTILVVGLALTTVYRHRSEDELGIQLKFESIKFAVPSDWAVYPDVERGAVCFHGDERAVALETRPAPDVTHVCPSWSTVNPKPTLAVRPLDADPRVPLRKVRIGTFSGVVLAGELSGTASGNYEVAVPSENVLFTFSETNQELRNRILASVRPSTTP